MLKFSILYEFWTFLNFVKSGGLHLSLSFLLFIGALIVLTEGPVIAPFIYTLF
jgi:hypothetical protein|tara:strand:- start:161 stop:319 length:159 start_codon:yes stop_codon:yes gene_type:complete